MKIEKIYVITFVLLLALAIVPFVFAQNTEDTIDTSLAKINDTIINNNITICTVEGETTNPTLGPSHYVACCEGLDLFFLGIITNSDGIDSRTTGAPSVCYDPAKGELECYKTDSNNEGYYQNGDLLLLKECDGVINVLPHTPNYESICEYYGYSWKEEVNACVGMNASICEEYGGKTYSGSSSCIGNDNPEAICTADMILACIFPQEEPVVIEEELRPFQNIYGQQMRVEQLKSAITRAIKGQELIIEFIEDNYPEENTTTLDNIVEKLNDILEKTQSIDFEADKQSVIDAFHTLKTESKELIALFRETAHELLSEGDVAELRKKVRDMKSDELNELKERVRAKINQYNSEKAKEMFKNMGFDNKKLFSDIESGIVNSNEIRNAVAQKLKSLDAVTKKEIDLKTKEYKVRLKVQKDAVTQRFKESNITAIREKLRVDVGLGKLNTLNNRQRNSAQGVNTE